MNKVRGTKNGNCLFAALTSEPKQIPCTHVLGELSLILILRFSCQRAHLIGLSHFLYKRMSSHFSQISLNVVPSLRTVAAHLRCKN